MAGRSGHNLPLQAEGQAEVFDRGLLARYTLDSQELEREIVDLFLLQLPETVAMMTQEADAGQWRFAAHALKGSASAVGALRLVALARDLETAAPDPVSRNLVLADLHLAITQFRAAVARAYSPR
ncbi:MAG: Hpt domain-containing protein [Alphaproteobacteria bacterium]|nr:Hpt domain-containing protein [Alphaproteobacteria bacterium]